MRTLTYWLLFFVLIVSTIAIGSSQFAKKELITVILQHQVNLEAPPENIFVVSTSEQSLSGGKKISKGTRFIGKLTKLYDDFIIDFNEVQTPDGEKEKFLAKVNLNIKGTNQASGVSAKISKTLYQKTQTNVLGAIFTNPSNTQVLKGTILQRGTVLKLEID